MHVLGNKRDSISNCIWIPVIWAFRKTNFRDVVIINYTKIENIAESPQKQMKLTWNKKGRYTDLQHNLTSAQQSMFCVWDDRQFVSNPCVEGWSKGQRCLVFSPIPNLWITALEKIVCHHSPALRAIRTDSSAYPLATTKWFHAVSLCVFLTGVETCCPRSTEEKKRPDF